MLPELLLSLAVGSSTAAAGLPNPDLTPGELCTQQDPDYIRTQHVGDPNGPDIFAVCRRHVTKAMKKRVEQEYGITPDQAKGYVIDHRIPLCAGGSNDIKNLWPQPVAQSHEKDRLEDVICSDLRSGVMGLPESIDMILKWLPMPKERRGKR